MPRIAIEKRGEQAPAGIELKRERERERVLSSSLSLSLSLCSTREQAGSKNVPGINCVTTLRLDDNCRETSFIAIREEKGEGERGEGRGGLMNRLECFYLLNGRMVMFGRDSIASVLPQSFPLLPFRGRSFVLHDLVSR